MNLILDAASEVRVQRELERGHYSEPSEVVAHALALLEDQEEWLLRHLEHFANRRKTKYCCKKYEIQGFFASLRMTK